MAVNDFNKEERVMFEDIFEGFEDQLVASQNVNTFGTNGTLMERTNDTIWRPQQVISVGGDRIIGSDITIKGKTKLSVPAVLDKQPHDNFQLTALELRDALADGTLGIASRNYIASRVNSDVLDTACNQATIVVPISTAAGDYDDIALCESVMNEMGVMADSRYMMLNTRDYNGMAGNLASRSTMTGKPTTAYEKSYVGPVANFETFKLDTGNRIAAAAGGGSLTIDTQASAANYYVPRATRTESTYGNTGNVDNRYQTITVSSTTNVAAGDCFTVAGVEAVHHVRKTRTGQLKTFRVMEVLTSTTMVISPPMVSNQGASDAGEQYQNVYVAPSATAAITFLNSDASGYNVFWRKPAIELLPGRYEVPSNQGVQTMNYTTKNGIQIVVTKSFDQSTFVSTYAFDARYGVVMTAPEQCGVLLFNQVP